ncbi:PepSY domain-containing protein [Nocardia niwae]|uniref:PepSY domain-containing protein n=1 Tax=Nocardia niwae TaxID=626084 RepID=A0ABV2X7D4_9NOCA|nr:PepSY domain-containing protein [Nocardia niwae]
MKATVRRTLSGRRGLLACAAAAAVLIGGPVALYATASPQAPARHAVTDHEWSLTSAPAIGEQQAADKAREAVPGSTVIATEFDDEGSTSVWEVELRTPDGVEHEVTIDATSGAVLRTVRQD